MRRTIHLAQRGISPARCLACGETVIVTAHRGSPALCHNRDSWNTTYRNNLDFRRCIDKIGAFDGVKRERFPEPTVPGFYWAEWRIVEEGTYPADVGFEHHSSFTPEVVRVYARLNTLDDDLLIVDVAGYEKEQPLENFVWRSAKLEVPT